MPHSCGRSAASVRWFATFVAAWLYFVTRQPTVLPQWIYTVHVTKPDGVGAVEIVFWSEHDACVYAEDRSRDFRILSASVTRFQVGELGARHPVAWYVKGEQQVQRFDRQLYPTDGTNPLISN
jgi:hypothetical protein